VRLAVLTNDYPPKPGGIQQYLSSLVAALPGEVMVLAPHDPAATAPEPGVRRHHRSFMWPTPATADWAVAELTAFAPDAVLIGAPHPLPALAGRLGAELGVPVGVLAHGAEVTLPAAVPGARTALARTLAGADVLFAVSRFTEDRVRRLTGCDVTYLGAGVDIARFVPTERGRHRPGQRGDGDPSPPVIGCVSRFVPRKGQRRLIDAVARLRAGGSDCGLMLVGKGRTERALRLHAAERGVPARFAVDVPWDALPGLYAAMDIFAMPCRSRWGGLEVEGLGLVYLEAAATGLPVVTGDSGGAPETVDPGVTGYVAHDEDDLVGALGMLLDDGDRRLEMGAAGRRRIEDRYTWDGVVARLLHGFAAVA
jgi:phosphatidylinositol alpha-1,6-mannosyltransferase